MIKHSKDFDINTGVIIVVLCLAMAIAPILALAFAIFFYREKISFLFFILYAFYFGWFYEPQLDLLVHYNHFKTLIDKPLEECWKDPETRHLGKEVYPILFKYFVGQISDSPNLFSACAAAVYASAFSGMLYVIRSFYIQNLTPLGVTALCGIIFTVEYNWFLGFRFWTGAFVFMMFFLKYMQSGQIKHLLFSSTACLFHFSHILLPAIFLIDYAFKNNLKARIGFVISGVIVRYTEFNPFVYITKLTFLRGYIKESSFNANIVKSVNERMEEIRASGNQFYLIRNDVLFWTCFFVIFMLYKRDKNLINYNNKYFRFMLVFYAIINFGYMDLTFYDREYKLLILMMFIYLLMYVSDIAESLNARLNYKLSIPLSVAIFYGALTIVVSQRDFLWRINVWFNSFLF